MWQNKSKVSAFKVISNTGKDSLPAKADIKKLKQELTVKRSSIILRWEILPELSDYLSKLQPCFFCTTQEKNASDTWNVYIKMSLFKIIKFA